MKKETKLSDIITSYLIGEIAGQPTFVNITMGELLEKELDDFVKRGELKKLPNGKYKEVKNL